MGVCCGSNKQALKKPMTASDIDAKPSAKVRRPMTGGNMGVKPTLGYWSVRGRGAAIRYQLVYENV